MILISYASNSYYENFQDMLAECCEKFSVPHKRYTRDWFRSTDYFQRHHEVAERFRMDGFAIWKPYIILDALQTNDLVCYVDASVVFETDPKPSIEAIENIACGDAGESWISREWIKRDAFVLMNCDNPLFWESFIVWAGVTVVRKCAEKYIQEMLSWCEDPRIITDDENVMGFLNFVGFKENRSEQAILTLMQVRYPDIIKKATFPFHDYTGDYTDWRSWKEKGRRNRRGEIV